MAPSATNGSSSRASNDEKPVPLLVNNKDVTSSKILPIHNPKDGSFLHNFCAASKADAIKAVEAAQAAFPAWSKTKPTKIRDILLKTAAILESRAEEAGKYCCEETGAPEQFGAGFNVPVSVEMFRDVAGRIAGVGVGSVPVVSEDERNAIVLKVPYGVVLGIAPWNAPYVLGFRAAIYAIATGNTVVLKGSELCPRTYWLIGDVLRQAGLPDGVINVIEVAPEDASEVITAIIEHSAVRKINYTGSTAVGKIIAGTAGKNLKPVLMELGGKASAVVLKDADLKKAAFQCALGAFLHGGQICMSTERVLVHSSIIEPFEKEFKAATDQIFSPGNPAPTLVTGVGVKKNKSLVKDAVAKGAKVVHGEHEAAESMDNHMRPLIIRGVGKDMDLYYTESFGPTVSLYSFESEDEAVRIANDTEYGLAGAVFSEDLRAALRVAKQIESGAVHINGMTVHDEPGLPHGGVKYSGFGRFGESKGLEEFLQTKTITWYD